MNKTSRRKSFNIKNTIKAIFTCGLCLLMLALPLACQRGIDPEILDPDIDSGEHILPSIIPGTEEPISSLRLRYHDEGNLNPLRKHSYSTAAIFTLVYDSLFAYDAAGVLHPDLADSAVLSEDQLIWTISLRDINFHSGEKLTSADVEASLRFWLNINLNHIPDILIEEEIPSSEETGQEIEEDPDNPHIPEDTGEEDLPSGIETEESTSEPVQETIDDEYNYYIDTPVLGEAAQIELYSGTLAVSLERGLLIEAIGRPNANTLQIKLQEAGPILDLLTFPIVPAANVESSSYQFIPGTGEYQISERDDNGHLILKRQTADDAKITKIIAYNCAGVIEALELFEDDNLDILLLGREEAARLRERSRVRSQNYTDSGYVSLYVPDSGLKAQLETAISQMNPDYLSSPFPYLPYYIRSGDFRLLEQNDLVIEPSNTFPTTVVSDPQTVAPDTDTENTDEDKPENLPEYRVLMPRVYYPLGLQSQLASLIAQSGARAEFIMVRSKDYRQELLLKKYDIALLLDESASYGDPYDYALGLLRQNLISDIDVTSGQLAILKDGRYRQAELSESSSDNEASYLQNVNDLFADLPVIGLSGTSTLLWYRDGVEGTLSGTAELPYEGIESIRVWQP